MEGLTIPALVNVLKKVPAVTFRISDLAPRLIDRNGKVNIDRCVDHQGELNLAITEIESYIKDAKEAREAMEYAGTREELEEED